MKKIFLFTVMCVAFSICYAQENKVSEPANKPKPAEPKETIVFDKSKHDFGVISESDGILECEFTFVNEGDTPLVLTQVSPSCGCTAADYTKEPVAPGKKGFIKATLNPRGFKNEVTREITVFSNGIPARKVLSLTLDAK